MLVKLGGTRIDVKERGVLISFGVLLIFVLGSIISFSRSPSTEIAKRSVVRKTEDNGSEDKDKLLFPNQKHSATGQVVTSKVAEPLEVPQPDVNTNEVKMAMHSANDNYDEILRVQKKILTEQIRPPDTHYNINITLSDTISMDRVVQDTRPEVCKTFTYDRDTLGTATVVIPFFNEALSMVLRTVHSVLNNSPDKLLKEVILVDDLSTRDYLKDSLADYIKLLPKTRIIRNQKREGLIRSRMAGSRAATSDVVIFLDAHAETNVGWLEPLLQEIKRNPRVVLQPFIDGIEPQNIHYSSPPSLYKGSFSWDLRYTWLKVSDKEAELSVTKGEPYFSPTLVGCAIAVQKAYFEEIGEFDGDMEIWGGENIELGFRTWQCHGKILTVICSRVGHVFKNFPYKFEGPREKIVTKNLIRLVETWMDGYGKYFYASTFAYNFKEVEFTDADWKSLQPRQEIRKRLKCHNFDWYMFNIIPELETPSMDALYYGEIQNIKSKACWEVLDDYWIGMNYLCYEHKIMPQNYFYITKEGLIKYKGKCVKFVAPNPALRLAECPKDTNNLDKYGWYVLDTNGHVAWGRLYAKHKDDTGATRKHCVGQVTNVWSIHLQEQMPQLGRCDDANDFQLWAFNYKFAWDKVPERALESVFPS